MSDELFEIPQQLSPRLRWINKHGIWTQRFDAPSIAPEFRWKATADGKTGTGPSEDEAIKNLVDTINETRVPKMKMWMEEP